MKNLLNYLIKRRSFKYLIVFFSIYLIKRIFIYYRMIAFIPESIKIIIFLSVIIWWVLFLYYIFLIIWWIRKKVFWKIRNRLIVSQFFISVMPIILVLLLVGIAALLIIYQVASYQINNYLSFQAKHFNEKMNSKFKCEKSSSDEQLKNLLIESSKNFNVEGIIPVIALVNSTSVNFIYKGEQNKIMESFPIEKLSSSADIIYSKYLTLLIKKYIKYEPQESVIPDTYFLSYLECNENKIYIFSPLEKQFLERTFPILGYSLSQEYYGGNSVSENVQVNIPIGKSSMDEVNSGSGNNFPVLVLLKEFSQEIEPEKLHVVIMNIDFKRTVLNMFYGKSYMGIIGQKILHLLFVVAVIFIIVEIISLLIGIKITRAVTKAVNILYKGTNRIQSGDLDTQIKISSEDQLAELANSFNKMVLSIKELLVEKTAKEAMEKDLEIARDVQKYLFPAEKINFASLEIVNQYVAARMVSGDYYDFFPYENQLFFVIGDVSGKGISAGLIMANTQAILRSHYLQTKNNGNIANLSNLINNINNHLLQYTSSHKFITMTFTIYDAMTKNITYCNAGHCPPLLFRADGSFDKLLPTSPILGAFENIPFATKTIQLNSNDIILFYTDGLIEAFNEQGEEYGEARIVNYILQNKALPLNKLIDSLITDINIYTDNNLSDDIAIIAIKIK